MAKQSLYLVCKTLDQPIRVIGLPLDEFIPALLLGMFFFFLGKDTTALMLAVLSIIIMRTLKKGRGNGWLLNLIYWNLPEFMTKSFFRHTPSSRYREWIS